MKEENIDNPLLCTNSDISICEWYLKGHAANVPTNTNDWEGGDFLPYSYVNAAFCACMGGTASDTPNPLWKTPIASCVRKEILRGHIEDIPSDMKKSVRQSTIADKPPTVPIVNTLYDIHVKAYKTCKCPGTPADLLAWEAVYSFTPGALMPCTVKPGGELFWILEAGRCGCGW